MEGTFFDIDNSSIDFGDSFSQPSAGKNLCENKLIFWGQYGQPICWFISMITSTFYSQRLRRKLFKAARGWNLRNSLFHLLDHILRKKYVQSKNKIKDVKFMRQYSPLAILHKISQCNPNYFFRVENWMHGFNSFYFIKYFYNTLGIDSIMIDTYRNNTVIYSLCNHITNITDPEIGYDSIQIMQPQPSIIESELSKTPDVLIVAVYPNSLDSELKLFKDVKKEDLNNYNLSPINAEQISSLHDNIMYNGVSYVLDAVILNNWNTAYIRTGHVIAGITCKGKKYIYNGWANADLEDADNVRVPCKLKRQNWITYPNDTTKTFCLHRTSCSLLSRDDSTACFSFNKGRRLLLYVRSPQNTLTSSIPDYATHNPDEESKPFSSYVSITANKRKRESPPSPTERHKKYILSGGKNKQSNLKHHNFNSIITPAEKKNDTKTHKRKD